MSADPIASIKGRLLNHARASGVDFELMLTRYAIERLLYRLGASAARDRCMLKGASLLSVWLPEPHRATRDIDLLATGSADDDLVRALLVDICEVLCPEDGVRFDLSGLILQTIRPEEGFRGRRARFQAFLGKSRMAIQIDVGFGDAVVQAEEIDYPVLLQDLPAPRLHAYSRETAVAEKFDAMVKLDTRNSRMKDFHDVWALAEAFAFNGARLQMSVAACFDRRSTPRTTDLPSALTPAFYRTTELKTRWRSYRTGSTVLVPPPAEFADVGERVIGFLGPVWTGIVANQPMDGAWLPGGPWR